MSGAVQARGAVATGSVRTYTAADDEAAIAGFAEIYRAMDSEERARFLFSLQQAVDSRSRSWRTRRLNELARWLRSLE